MKRYFRKVGILLIVSMMICILDRANPVQAASAWSFFSTGSGKQIAVNETVTLQKNMQRTISIYKNGKEIKENNATYKVKWLSSNSDVVWVDPNSGALQTDKFGKMKSETARAKITAKITNKKTGATTKKSFVVRVKEKAASIADSTAIQPLGMVRDWPEIENVNGVQAYDEFYGIGQKRVEDVSGATALAYSLTFSDKTEFGKIPNGYNPEEVMEWGKDPGLNVDILHKYGFTGKGATIAYVDQPIDAHEQYENLNLHYVNNTSTVDSMHGPAVLSLLAGKEIGTAPEAEVYYYGHAAWYADQTTHAECLYQIIEQNKTLGEDEKITMVGFSDNIDSSEDNVKAFEEAVKACEDAGVMVWFCGEYGGGAFLPMSDKNDYHNLISEAWWGNYTPSLVMVPASGRTTAATMGDEKYIYWGEGGLSWTMPYVLGLYAIALEINPALTQDDLRTLLVDTAYINNDMPIVNPVGFVAEVLKGVGRTKEAQAMLDEVEARSKYMYAIMDTAAMSKEDLEAVGGYLATITDATVLVADAAAFSNAEELYTALREDARVRGGQTVGVQIFGTADMVPAFSVQYKVQMPKDVDEGGMFLSDLFYGNFDNDVKKIANGYNVMDHFAEGWDVELVPDWPVARLPLSKGKYKAFFEKYENFVEVTGLERQELVNFSNPIFASTYHTDDMGTFLNRMNEEFGLLDVSYRLYGNQKGQYPVRTKVKGGFTAKNLSAENKKGIAEFIINSHGQVDNIDQCYFENGKEVRESLINKNNINKVLNKNPYYLDCWTCNNGFGMQDNLTTTALNGNCVGMFSATTIISNNGVNCRDSVKEMEKSNFYYFYYHYLKALHDGETRSEAFSVAQRAYAEALIEDSRNGIRGDGNYQFNLCNLLTYHNFGVLEPNRASAAFEAEGYIAQAGQSVPKVEQVQSGGGQSSLSSSLVVTDGKTVGEPMDIPWSDENNLKSGEVNVHGCTAQKLDNGYIRFTIDFTARAGMPVSIFDPPNGEHFKMIAPPTSDERENITYDVKVEDVQNIITMRFNFDDTDWYRLYLNTWGIQ